MLGMPDPRALQAMLAVFDRLGKSLDKHAAELARLNDNLERQGRLPHLAIPILKEFAE